jgi:hypothetical protein
MRSAFNLRNQVSHPDIPYGTRSNLSEMKFQALLFPTQVALNNPRLSDCTGFSHHWHYGLVYPVTLGTSVISAYFREKILL